MSKLKSLVILAASFAAVAAYANAATAGTAPDAQAIRAVGTAWNKAYNAGDAAALAALYGEDAVLLAPGAPATRSRSAIARYYAKDAPEFAGKGLTTAAGPTSDVEQSGDLAWESETYKVTDKSGQAVDSGKFLTVLQRMHGKWMIIRDTWNSDATSTLTTDSAEPSSSSSGPT